MKKIVVCLLLVALLLPCIPAFSLDDSLTDEDLSGKAYYSPFDITDTDGINADLCIDHYSLNIQKASSSLTFSKTGGTDEYSNTLKLVIENLSDCRSIDLKIYYSDGSAKKTLTKRLEIDPRSSKKSYFVDFDYIQGIEKITVSFRGVKSGTVNLYSFSDIYIYRERYDVLSGTNIKCYFDYDDYTVHFVGSIGHTTFNNYKNATIEIYRTEVGEDVTEKDTYEPIEKSSMRIEFDFAIKVNDLSEAYSQYSLIINDGKNGKKFLCRPVIPRMINNSDEEYNSGGFKGISSEVTVDAIDANPSTVNINIDIARLESKDGSGYYFDIDGKHYYFNREYLLQLDSKMESYFRSNCNIYFKFELPSEGDALEYSTEDAMYKRDLFAYTYYLIQRYGNKGNIIGIIVGERSDRFKCDTPEKAASYINAYSNCVLVISEAVKCAGTSLKMIVPVSDIVLEENFDGNGYVGEGFLYALADKFENGFSDPINFYVQLNSDFSPVIFNETDEKCILNDPTSKDRYAAKNIEDFEAVLSGICGEYSCISNEYCFLWNVPSISGSLLSASYIYNFLKLYFDSNTQNFTVSFYSDKANENTAVLSDLKYIIKYIDTKKCSDIIDIMLSAFGIDSIDLLISDYDKYNMPNSRLSEVDFEESQGYIKGKYYFWDFNEDRTSDMWSSINGCRLITVESCDFGRCLIAKMQKHSSLSGEYASIIYSFENPVDLSYCDFLTYSVGMDCEPDPDAVFEIMLVYGFENGVAEAKKTVQGGRLIDFTVDTDTFGKLSYLQVNVKPVSNQEVLYDLCISGIYESSSRYSSEELAEFALKYSGSDSDESAASERFISYKEVIWILIFFVLIIIVFVTILKKVDKKEK